MNLWMCKWYIRLITFVNKIIMSFFMQINNRVRALFELTKRKGAQKMTYHCKLGIFKVFEKDNQQTVRMYLYMNPVVYFVETIDLKTRTVKFKVESRRRVRFDENVLVQEFTDNKEKNGFTKDT